MRRPPLSAICLVAVAATLLHAAQAIMTVPSPGYFTQANIGLVLIAALAAEGVGDELRPEGRSANANAE